MLSMYVTPGDRVEINGIRKGDSESIFVKKTDKVYQSQVYDVLSEDQLEIVMPMQKTKLILLPIDSEYELFFYTKEGLYQCYARITDRYKSNNTYLVVMELISNLSKYQRREFYRLSCAMDMNLRSLTEAEAYHEYPIDEFLPLHHAIMVDISGGGIRCVGRHLYEEGSFVLMRFVLYHEGKPREYRVTGSVLQNREIESRPGEYEHRIRYEEMDTNDREEIIRYIFEEERKYRKRERGE